LADNDSAESRGDNRVAIKCAQAIRQSTANVRRNICVLKKQRALKILATVQTGAQDEMTIEQRTCLSKQCEQVFVHEDVDLGDWRI
jgi:hypothetical protein